MTCLLPSSMRAMAVAATSLALAGTAAQAATVEYNFTGTVIFDAASRDFTAFSGIFKFNSDAVDAIADTSTASYPSSGAPYGANITFTGGSGNTTLNLQDVFTILVTNNLGGRDTFGFLAMNSAGTNSFSFSAFDTTQSVFASDALPLVFGGLTLSQFSGNEFTWDSGAGQLQGELTSLGCAAGCVPPVPEAGTAPMAAAGLAMLGGLAWRRSRRISAVALPAATKEAPLPAA